MEPTAFTLNCLVLASSIPVCHPANLNVSSSLKSMDSSLKAILAGQEQPFTAVVVAKSQQGSVWKETLRDATYMTSSSSLIDKLSFFPTPSCSLLQMHMFVCPACKKWPFWPYQVLSILASFTSLKPQWSMHITKTVPVIRWSVSCKAFFIITEIEVIGLLSTDYEKDLAESRPIRPDMIKRALLPLDLTPPKRAKKSKLITQLLTEDKEYVLLRTYN